MKKLRSRDEFATRNAQPQCESNSKKLAELQIELTASAKWLSNFTSEEEKNSLALKVLLGTTEDKIEFINELANGKWQFMMKVDLFCKMNLGRPFYVAVEDFDVERIDSALPEIRQRLNCEVLKMWQQEERVFLSKVDENSPNLQDKTIHRIGWLIEPNTTDNKKEVVND